MDVLNTAILQILPTESLEGNRQKGEAYCRLAKANGADIALFPEMWSSGYRIPQEKQALVGLAIPGDGGFVTGFADLARELDMAIGVTYLERVEDGARNTMQLFDRFGRSVLTYAKVHTCDFGDERVLTPGDGFPVAELDTARGAVRVGAMICYDREFPESARILMLQGAEVILAPNACPMEVNRLSQLRGRAYENMVCIVTANYPKGQPDCNGHSSAYDGVAYRPDEHGSRDTLIIEAGEGEGIYLARLPIGELREYRSREVHGNAYRRPSLYQMLTEEQVSAPFIRGDARR